MTAKTTAALKAAGTYRADRHAGRMDAAPGSPIPRADLDDEKRELFAQIVENLPKSLVSELDSAALGMICDLYAIYRDAERIWRADLLDTDARLAACSAFDRFWKVAMQFGLTPGFRARLIVPADPEDDEPFDQLLGRLGGGPN